LKAADVDMKKVTMLAWIRTIRLLIKYRFNLGKAREDTDRELAGVVSEKILKTAYEGDEIKN
jgi:hypothetical protein